MLRNFKEWVSGLTGAKVVRLIGLLLFAASFAMPDADFSQDRLEWSWKDRGLSAFLMTPLFLIGLIAGGSGWRELIAGIMLAASWFTNFTMMERLPKVAAWIPSSVQWLFLLTCWLDWFPNGRGAVGYLPFYVWAAGVGLFHGASYLEGDVE